METCSIETGLFKKKPCGQAAVTKCANCEQPLCKQHAVATKKAGVYTCKECAAADRQFDKNQADVAKQEKAKREADLIKSMMNPPAVKPKTSYAPGAPAAAAAAKPAATPPAAAAPAAPAAPKPADDAPLEFTPSKPKPADDAPPLEFNLDDDPKKK